MRSIPENAFQQIDTLTLLALDGNPMSSVPEEAFIHLNKTLKGLSLGGRFMVCNCQMAWVPRWIRDYDLQVICTYSVFIGNDYLINIYFNDQYECILNYLIILSYILETIKNCKPNVLYTPILVYYIEVFKLFN